MYQLTVQSLFDFFDVEEERGWVETAAFLVEKRNLTITRSDAVKREVRIC